MLLLPVAAFGAVALLALFMLSGAGGLTPASAAGAVCTAKDVKVKVTGGSVPGTEVPITAARAVNIRATLSVAAGMHMGTQGELVGLITEEQESKFLNLANPGRYPETLNMPHDGVGQDHGSVGTFQQQPQDGWGTPAQDMTPRYAATRFYEALNGIGGWQQMAPEGAAQAVQQSEDGSLYTQWIPDARKIMAHYKGAAAPKPATCAASTGPGGDKAPNQKVATVVAAERHFLGTPYAWGGGTDAGPSVGEPPDTGVVGFDCSSLQMYAWHKAGVDIPRTSSDQYSAGKHVPIAQLRPGDLVFWSSVPGVRAGIHHVALYLGKVKGVPSILQAPQSGEFVDIHALHWPGGDDQLMPNAVRLT